MYPGRLKNVKDGKQYSLQCSGLGWKKCAHQHGNVVFVARRQCTSFTAQIVDQQPTIVKNAVFLYMFINCLSLNAIFCIKKNSEI